MAASLSFIHPHPLFYPSTLQSFTFFSHYPAFFCTPGLAVSISPSLFQVLFISPSLAPLSYLHLPPPAERDKSEEGCSMVEGPLTIKLQAPLSSEAISEKKKTKKHMLRSDLLSERSLLRKENPYLCPEMDHSLSLEDIPVLWEIIGLAPTHFIKLGYRGKTSFTAQTFL